MIDEPGQPGRPNILDWGPNHCDMSWALPDTDGGSPITHYVIELKVREFNCDNLYRVSAKKVRFSLRAYCFTIMKSFLTPNGSSEKLLFSTFQKSPRLLRLDISLWS